MNSRIPKFRVWDKKRKAFFPMYPCFNSASQSVSITTDYLPKHENATHNDVRDSENFEFCQSTGLKDVNGVEIFEGDIFEFEGRNEVMQGEVFKEDCIFRITYGYKNPEECKRKDYFLTATLENGTCKSISIIGNIYENPELCNEKSKFNSPFAGQA